MKQQRFIVALMYPVIHSGVCYQSEDLALHHLKVINDAKGYLQVLKQTGNQYHFVMEATGVYHISLMFFLHQHHCTYSVVNALQIKRYIQMHLERNKTDKKDAKRICEYEMPAPLYFECKTLNNAIKKITSEIIAFTNQVHSLEKLPVYSAAVVKCYKKFVKELKQQQQLLEKELEKKLLQWQPELVKKVNSVMAIGKRAAAELIIHKGLKE